MNITPSATEQLERVLGPGEYLEIGLTGGGCGGATVTLTKMDLKNTEGLSTGENTNVRFADQTSAQYLTGGKLDYDNGVLSASFIFKPPLGTESCGCGSSIRID